jgi:hypothetical protein
VANPTTNYNDIFKSILVASHPTGYGHLYLADRMAQQIKALLGAK